MTNAIADTHPKDGDDFSAPLVSGAGRQASPDLFLQFIDQIWADHDKRHAWLIAAGEQARKMNLESKGDDDGCS